MAHRIVWAVALAALLGCGGATSGDTSGDEANFESFGKRYAAATCALSAKCRSLAQYLLDDCPAQRDLANFLPLVRAGRTTVDAAAAEACLKVVESLTCDEWEALAGKDAKIFAECAQVFQGHILPGQACHDGAECADGVCVLEKTCLGVCRAKKKPGDACANQDCGYSDSACGASGTCSAIGHAGDPCFRDGFEDCAFGLDCSTKDGIVDPSSICVERRPKGASCEHASCANGFACTANVCSDKLAEGAACADEYSCSEGLVCARLSITYTSFESGTVTPGICRHPNELGGACTEFRGGTTVTGCATGLECVGGACTMPPASGPCGMSYGCAPGTYCSTEQQCVPQDPDGTACIDGVVGQCVGGGCRNGVCASPCAL